MGSPNQQAANFHSTSFPCTKNKDYLKYVQIGTFKKQICLSRGVDLKFLSCLFSPEGKVFPTAHTVLPQFIHPNLLQRFVVKKYPTTILSCTF
jgi:hypothetical protein